jgi:biotin operon repressor
MAKTFNDKEEIMLPQDPVILLSYMNTQLRDNYSSLESLAEGLDIGADELDEAVNRLKEMGYAYDAAQNKFV